MPHLANAPVVQLDFIDHCVGNQPDDQMEDVVKCKISIFIG